MKKKTPGKSQAEGREEINKHCALFYVQIFTSLSLIRGKALAANAEVKERMRGGDSKEWSLRTARGVGESVPCDKAVALRSEI